MHSSNLFEHPSIPFHSIFPHKGAAKVAVIGAGGAVLETVLPGADSETSDLLYDPLDGLMVIGRVGALSSVCSFPKRATPIASDMKMR